MEGTPQQIERAYRIARATYHPQSTATYSAVLDRRVGLDPAPDRGGLRGALRRPPAPRVRRAAAPGRPERRAAVAERRGARSPPVRESSTSRRCAPGRCARPRAEAEIDGWAQRPRTGVFDGDVLRRIRVSLGIELEEIVATTKISEHHLARDRGQPTTMPCPRQSTCAASAADRRVSVARSPARRRQLHCAHAGELPPGQADGPSRHPRARAPACARVDLRRRGLRRGDSGPDRLSRRTTCSSGWRPRSRARACSTCTTSTPAWRSARSCSSSRSSTCWSTATGARRRTSGELRAPRGARARWTAPRRRAQQSSSPTHARARLRRLVESGAVTVSGGVAKPAHRLKLGERIAGAPRRGGSADVRGRAAVARCSRTRT